MKKSFLLLLLGVMGCLSVAAQSRGGLRINEVMVDNTGSIVDDYGEKGAWVELFNSTFAPLEISSVYITTVKFDNPDSIDKALMYAVPLGDVNTRIPKRQHVIFWADSLPTRGTFHTNFVLTPGRDNYIAIYDADGRTLIDEIVVPADLAAGSSYARKIDGEGGTNDPEAWEVRDGSEGKYITPSSNNIIKDTNKKVDTFHERDKRGFALTIMAMCIVFTALLVLCLCFMLISKIGEKITRANKMKSQGLAPKEVARDARPDHDSGEEIAAIVMALHEHLDAHDTEQTILTINKVKKSYSPWNSKIYSMRELPKR
ncbi:MAG: lamin tail domain-containing protein [Bacteroidales bacterium]|nr:lamin tail domain-containing protein [Bacteroidales bacterium]